MTDSVGVRIKRLPHGEGLELPAYATPGAAGMDVLAAEDVTLAPGARHAVATGFAVAIPAGFEIQVRPRSGLALKHGISVPNTPGTIDSDYRGELKVIIINHGAEAFAIARGGRIRFDRGPRQAGLSRRTRYRYETGGPLRARPFAKVS